MNHKLRQALSALGTSPAQPQPHLDGSLDLLASWMDAHQTVILHSVVEHTPVTQLIDGVEKGDLSAGPEALALCLKRLAWLRDEVTLKFGEFRDKWRQRLDAAMVVPFLRKNGWFMPVEGGFRWASRGGRKDAKMLFLQTLHDMSADCERQVSSAGGHIARIQNEVATVWHRESVRDNASRILPALEAVMRQGEADAFKKMRLNLGDLASEHFQSKVHMTFSGKADPKPAATENELYQAVAATWHRPPRTANGFEGFMLHFADLSEALCQAMLDHYQAKWELFLRGLQSAHAQVEQAPNRAAHNMVAPTQD